MIHMIAKTYCITKRQAAGYTEYDFWEMLGFENIEAEKNEFLLTRTKAL